MLENLIYLNELSVIEINRIQSNLMKRLSSMVKTIELNHTHKKRKRIGQSNAIERSNSQVLIYRLKIICLDFALKNWLLFVSYVIHWTDPHSKRNIYWVSRVDIGRFHTKNQKMTENRWLKSGGLSIQTKDRFIFKLRLFICLTRIIQRIIRL